MLRCLALLVLSFLVTACASAAATPGPAEPTIAAAGTSAPAPPATPIVMPTVPAAVPAPPTAVPTAPPGGISPPRSGGGVTAPTSAVTPGSIPSGASGRTGWSPISAAAAPPARYDHTLTLDPAINRIVLFGGRDGSKTYGDTWLFDLGSKSWREVRAASAPEARFGHAAAYDPKSKRMLMFAGQGAGFFNDVWAFDAAKETWQKLATQGTAPAARYGTSAVVDTKRNTLIVTHGFSDGRFDDTFTLDLSTLAWAKLQGIDGQPLKRCLHESVYDAGADRMVLFGGCSSGFGPCPQGDLWTFDVAASDWNEVNPRQVKPSARSNPALVADGAGRLILFGGLTRDGAARDLWSYDIAAGEWTSIVTTGNTPAARSSHDAVWNPATRQVITFGGKGSSGPLNDLWVFTP